MSTSEPRARRRLGAWALIVALLGLSVGALAWWPRAPRAEPPNPDLADVDPQVGEMIARARQEVLQAPRSAKAWGRLGMVLRAHDLGEEANRCFKEAERLDAREPRWPYLHGLTLVLTDPETGARCLERAVERAGDQPGPRLRLAEVLLEQGRLEDAERHLKVALEREPGQPRARLGLARLAFAREDWRGGLAHLEGQEGPHDRKLAHTLRAEALHRLGEPARCAAELKRARELPDDAPWPDPFVAEVERLQVGLRAKLARADALARQGRGEESVALLEEVLQQQPEHVQALLLLGQTLVKLKRPGPAERVLGEAVRVAPGSVEAWFQLGVARVFLGQARGATEAFRAVVRLKPDHTLGHFNLGLCLKELGDRAGAASAFRQALRCQPDYEPARKALGALSAGGRADN